MTSRQLHLVYSLAVLAMALMFAVSAQAGATRTFVSTTGIDSNTSSNCGPTTPCRTFAAALSVTNAGGEVVVLTSGGYGPATISQPVVIAAVGENASISAISASNGLTINTPGNVTLIGLNLHGEGTAMNGIAITQVGILRLYSVLIEGFTVGVDNEISKVEIYDSAIFNNTSSGLLLNNASASAYVHGTTFDNNGEGVAVLAGHAVVSDSNASYNTTAFAVVEGTLVLTNNRASFNSIAMHSLTPGALYFFSCLIASNTTSYSIEEGSTMAGTSPGTSFIGPGQSTSGTLSTPIMLQ